MAMTQGRGERGFTLMEVLVALTVTVIGLLGVMMMQADTVRSNRQTQMFTRAANFAEEVMEKARGMTTTQLQGGMTFQPLVVSGTTYTVEATATDIAESSNLVLVTVNVRYDEDNDVTTSDDDRKAVVQMIRTRTEVL
jgi:type IV pilus assembly protein PilV